MSQVKIEPIQKALPEEIKRVRKLEIGYFNQAGKGNAFRAYSMGLSLEAAGKAMEGGSITEMIVAYEDLKGWKD